ncbi:hypothetical protein POM88_030573 [Heracleum sosnowskyi]|uniref:Inositol-tetrakisphosphate 1-kinase N-terminal domain-containing protein n=1 Tax=Heracleum sosnowskyi TaxID=360622 RepID=A0AAD8HYT6_9APIA|nr:hypothetical protein POM88_030573 [Heracleum sosnowskyi]
MEGVSRKRGRPRVVVTEAVAEARRLAVQQRNLRRDRRKGSSAAEASSSSGVVTGSPQPPPGGAIALLSETSLQRRRLNKRKQTFGMVVFSFAYLIGLFICLSGSFRAHLLISSFVIYLAAANNSILDIGDPDQHCGCCAAHVWQAEYTGRHSGSGPKGYSICCGKGKVQLPLLQETPVELAALLGGTTSRAKKIQKNIRVYNIIFALCSFGGSVDESINNGSGPFVFQVNDLTYHSIGSLLPPDGHTPKFAQFYMYDGQEAIEHHINFSRGNSVLDPAIVATLQEMLTRDNALVVSIDIPPWGRWLPAWVLSLGDGLAPTYVLDEDIEPSWVQIPKEVRVDYSGDPVKAYGFAIAAAPACFNTIGNFIILVAMKEYEALVKILAQYLLYMCGSILFILMAMNNKTDGQKGIVFVDIDQSRPLSEQGPFDIVMHMCYQIIRALFQKY